MTTTTSTSRRSSSDATLTLARTAGPTVHVRWSTRADGDFHRTEVPLGELEPRRRRLVDAPWTMLDEHHGTTVVTVDAPGAHDGAPGDVAVTRLDGAVLGCWVGDCAPVVVIGERDALAVAHAGWRGLAAGVLDVAVDALGDAPIAAVLGPCIGPCCYEFGADDLAGVVAGAGVATEVASGRTRWGSLALDVPAVIGAALARRGVPLARVGGCTGCSFDGYSHRVRREIGRHVVAAWQTGRSEEAPS